MLLDSWETHSATFEVVAQDCLAEVVSRPVMSPFRLLDMYIYLFFSFKFLRRFKGEREKVGRNFYH